MGKDTIVLNGETYKKVDKETTIHYILDDSYSMNGAQEATISAFNEYVESLKKDGNKYNFGLTKFADQVEISKVVPISEIKKLTKSTYRANGQSTALYDAVCKTLKRAIQSGGKNLLVIMTDGEENSSREFTQDDMRQLKSKLEEGGNWTFVFLGANQDSWANAKQWGFSASNVSNFNATTRGMKAASVNLAGATMSFAASETSSTSNMFTEQQQKDMEDTK